MGLGFSDTLTLSQRWTWETFLEPCHPATATQPMHWRSQENCGSLFAPYSFSQTVHVCGPLATVKGTGETVSALWGMHLSTESSAHYILTGNSGP